jgi:hypothetical protein
MWSEEWTGFRHVFAKPARIDLVNQNIEKDKMET